MLITNITTIPQLPNNTVQQNSTTYFYIIFTAAFAVSEGIAKEREHLSEELQMLKAKNAAMMDSRDSGGSLHGFSNNRQLSGERMSDIGDLHSLESINEDEVIILPIVTGKSSSFYQHPKPLQIELDDELYLKNYHSGGDPLRRQDSDNISLMDELNQSLQKTGSQHTTTLIIGARDWSVQSDRRLSSTAGTRVHTLSYHGGRNPL